MKVMMWSGNENHRETLDQNPRKVWVVYEDKGYSLVLLDYPAPSSIGTGGFFTVTPGMRWVRTDDLSPAAAKPGQRYFDRYYHNEYVGLADGRLVRLRDGSVHNFESVDLHYAAR